MDHPNWLYKGFREAVSDCNLEDLPVIGHQFTWARCWGTMNAVEERLDRAMVNPDWSAMFPNAKLSNFILPISDHSPILVDFEPAEFIRRSHPFRFENKWL